MLQLTGPEQPAQADEPRQRDGRLEVRHARKHRAPLDSTWCESFGKPFMEAYCTRCHASTLRGEQRQGAPGLHDFDTLFGIKVVFDHIDETTAAGPAATNTGMPPDTPAPTVAERRQLGEWLACGMPSMPTAPGSGSAAQGP